MALRVVNGSETDLQNTTTASGTSLQQVQTAEAFGVQNNQAPASVADPSTLELLRNEAAGTTFDTSITPTQPNATLLVSLTLLGLISLVAVLVVFKKTLATKRS